MILSLKQSCLLIFYFLLTQDGGQTTWIKWIHMNYILVRTLYNDITPVDLKLISTGYICRDSAFTHASEPQSRRTADANGCWVPSHGSTVFCAFNVFSLLATPFQILSKAVKIVILQKCWICQPEERSVTVTKYYMHIFVMVWCNSLWTRYCRKLCFIKLYTVETSGGTSQVLVRAALNESGQHCTYFGSFLLVQDLDMQWLAGVGGRDFRAGAWILEQE
jgi:hypothetical protein